jgi:hypothetical protein
MYSLYIPVLDFGFLRRPNSCVHAVVRAALLALTPTVGALSEKITIFKNTLKKIISK